MDIIIIGAGAVGIALGTSLQNTGHTVTYLARGGTAQAIREGGTARTGLFGEMCAPQAAVCERYEELPAADVVLVSAKTLANDAISTSLNEHRQWRKPGAKIVLMQNGWGNDIPYLRYFDKSELFHARIITGFQRSAPNVSNI
ncbi:MAG: ketopantoate reductase family protein, partial [Butyricicoccaceae bacterium]